MEISDNEDEIENEEINKDEIDNKQTDEKVHRITRL